MTLNMMIRNMKWFFACFLLVLYCGYRVSVTCFFHSHIVDGQIIAHSHPYKGTPDNPGHSHTNAQFLLIEFLSHIVILGAISVVLAHVFSGKIILRRLSYAFICERVQIRSYALRAPPM
jgi:hypothetical protein